MRLPHPTLKNHQNPAHDEITTSKMKFEIFMFQRVTKEFYGWTVLNGLQSKLSNGLHDTELPLRYNSHSAVKDFLCFYETIMFIISTKARHYTLSRAS